MKESLIKYFKILGTGLGVLLLGNLIYVLLFALAYKVLYESTASITLSDQEIYLSKTVISILSNLFYSLTVVTGIILGVAFARKIKTKFLRFILVLLVTSVILNLYITVLNLVNNDILNFLVNSKQEITFLDLTAKNFSYLLFNSFLDGITSMLPVISIGYLLGRALDNHKESKLFKLLRIRD